MKSNLSKSLLLLLGLICLFGGYALLVWPALSGPFLFDDYPNLQNIAILNNGMTVEKIREYLASFIGSPGRPLATLSFLLNATNWPTEPYPFKVTNLLIHLLNGGLLFGLLRQLVNACPAMPQSPFWPLLAMAAWLFHPFQLSAQMLVVQRMTLLSASFCLIGLWTYVVLLTRAKSTFDAFLALAALGTCTLLAFLCKENGALLPVFAWVLNSTLLSGLLASKTLAMRRLIKISCILPSLALFGFMLFMSTRPGAFQSRDFDMPERLMTQMHVLADYLRLIFMPRLSGSGIYFDDYSITRSWIQPISTLFLALSFLASLIFAIIKRRNFPVLSFAILWFLAGHVMESSILDLELYFEHRNYLPLLGPVIAISVMAFTATSRKVIGIGLFTLWLMLLATITTLQAPVWGDAKRLTGLWATERPMSLRATQELAKYQYDHGQPQAAADTLMDAYHRGLDYVDLPLTTMLTKCWNPGVVRPEDLYGESLQTASESPYSNSVLATMLLMRQAVQDGACEQTVNAGNWLTLSEALLKNPRFRSVAESHIRVERAKLFIHQRDLNLTMTELERAYAVEPTIELTQKIAEVLLSAGLTEDAEHWLKEGLKLRQPLFDRLLYDPKDRSRQWLKAIETTKSNQLGMPKGESRKL